MSQRQSGDKALISKLHHLLAKWCAGTGGDSRYRLRSTDTTDYVLPRARIKFGERGFCYSGPAVWNGLLPDLHDVTDTVTLTYSKAAQECTFIVPCSGCCVKRHGMLQIPIDSLTDVAVAAITAL